MEINVLKEQMITLYKETMTYKFDKETYESEIEKLKKKYRDLLNDIAEACESSEEIPGELISCIPDYVSEELRTAGSKRKKELAALDHKLNMVSFFMPLIGEAPSDRAKELTRQMTDAWNKKMPGNKIGHSTYESINGGFRRGLSCYISTEAPTHLHMLRSNNRYFRKTIAENIFVFLQHGITYLKCQGGNSVFVKGRESSPSYIIADSDKERDVLVRMLHLPPERILKTGMAIFSKIAWKHLNQDSEDIAVIMLTWKPYEEAVSDFTQTSYYKNTLGIYQLLYRYLSPEQIRIVIHPKTKGHLENTPLASCIWTQPISQVLSIAKLLITDYSSVCYNSFYQGGGVVFFQEDLQYYEKENGKLIPADDEYIGKRVFSLEALDDVLREGIVTEAGGRGRILLSSFRTEEFERRYHLINEYSDGKNIERICDALRTRGLI